jgi:hypothetical protein
MKGKTKIPNPESVRKKILAMQMYKGMVSPHKYTAKPLVAGRTKRVVPNLALQNLSAVASPLASTRRRTTKNSLDMNFSFFSTAK